MTWGARIRRRGSTVQPSEPLDGVTRRARTGSSRAARASSPPPPNRYPLPPHSLSLCSHSFAAAAASSHISDCRRRRRHVAMVSWTDEDSSEHSYQFYEGSDDGIIKIPATTEDSDFEGIETDLPVLCHEHGKPAERRVAFEGTLTGRRFLSCAVVEGKNCGLVEWIDPSWPVPLENALLKLWDMYEQCKNNRTEDNLMNSFAVHKLTQEKIKLQASYEKLVEDIQSLLDEQAQRAQMPSNPDDSKLQEKYDLVKNLTLAQAGVIRNMKLKLAEEKKLQAHIDELEKFVELEKVSRVKLNGIKAILDE